MLFTKVFSALRKVIHRRLRGEIAKALLAAGEQLWNTYKGCEARATPAHAPQENAGQFPADRVTQGDVNYIVD